MASTNIIGDINSVITNGPSATTKSNSLAAAGPINDYVGNCYASLVKAEEASKLANLVYGVTNASDDATNRGLLAGIIALLNGTSSPSTTALADLKTVIANGPSANTKAAANAAAGPINDYVGNCNVLLVLLDGLKVLLTTLYGVTAASDDNTNRTLISGITGVLV